MAFSCPKKRKIENKNKNSMLILIKKLRYKYFFNFESIKLKSVINTSNPIKTSVNKVKT